MCLPGYADIGLGIDFANVDLTNGVSPREAADIHAQIVASEARHPDVVKAGNGCEVTLSDAASADEIASVEKFWPTEQADRLEFVPELLARKGWAAILRIWTFVRDHPDVSLPPEYK